VFLFYNEKNFGWGSAVILPALNTGGRVSPLSLGGGGGGGGGGFPEPVWMFFRKDKSFPS